MLNDSIEKRRGAKRPFAVLRTAYCQEQNDVMRRWNVAKGSG